jgi:hypothetical protein
MTKKYFAYAGTVLYMLVLAICYYTVFRGYHTRLPDGCDQFGYLNMARVASQGILFSDHAERPFDKGLFDHLRRSSCEFKTYKYMACPHAYYLQKKYRPMNQYPPGTGLLLSLLPFEMEKTGAPAVFALAIMLFLLFGFAARSGTPSFFQANVMAILMAVALLASLPDITSHCFQNFNVVNAVAPTFGMLIAAGYLLDRKPGLSIALLGTSALFRIANAALFLPLAVIYLWRGFRMGDYLSQGTMVKAVRALLWFLAGGIGLYMLYVWIMLGSPFMQTYPDDFAGKGFVFFDRIDDNIGFYFSIYNRWFVLHCVILALMALMALTKKMPLRWLVVAGGMAAYNYCFYLSYRCACDYYPYASGVIIAGIFLRHAEDWLRSRVRLRRVVTAAGVLVVLAAALFSAVELPRGNTRALFYDQIKAYDRCFSGYDVVWAETRSGTVEYATGKAGFRYQWGPPETRKAVVSWLSSNGYRQALWVSDLQEKFRDTVDVEAELRSIPVDYTVKTCGDFGTIIEMRPEKPGGQAGK